ncbi:MAG: cupin domain-containing protein [Marinicaulis sp.]|nr:cupin domain-containing protein [Marinicaulis sp.]
MPAAPPNKPKLVSLEAGRKYAWCSCGQSAAQPFCDGSHKGTDKTPIVFAAKHSGETLLCQCKETKSPPYCDGSHNNLDDGYELASIEEIEATKGAEDVARTGGKFGLSMLYGGAFALTPAPDDRCDDGDLQWAALINAANGAANLHVFEFTIGQETEWRVHDECDVVFFVASGAGAIEINGSRACLFSETGACVKRGEAFRFLPSETMYVIAAVSPGGGAFKKIARPSKTSIAINDRIVAVDPANRKSMADRFYQELVDHHAGAENITQFIGEVPKSRAAFHRHLYEEAIYIISGSGILWTRGSRTNVSAGDILYLPARQEHSLECTSDDGLRLMGVLYPSGSPAINY